MLGRGGDGVASALRQCCDSVATGMRQVCDRYATEKCYSTTAD